MAANINSDWLSQGLSKFVTNRGNGVPSLQEWLKINANNPNSWNDLAKGVSKEQGVYGNMDDRALQNMGSSLRQLQGLSDLTAYRTGQTPGTNGQGQLGDIDSGTRFANYMNNGTLYHNLSLIHI